MLLRSKVDDFVEARECRSSKHFEKVKQQRKL